MNASMFLVPSFLKAFNPSNLDKREQSIRDIMSERAPGVVTFDMLQPRVCEMLLSSDWLGFALDSHHGFVVKYRMDKDVELGFHVDDSEVTLNEIFDYSHSVGRAIIHRGCHRHGARDHSLSKFRMLQRMKLITQVAVAEAKVMCKFYCIKLYDKRSVKYNILSGTFVSCPHVAASAAYVKSFHPEWSPSAIKSALMTTGSKDQEQVEREEFISKRIDGEEYTERQIASKDY
ncbi:uncharacterized PKHD-type hydroxylase isoform X2 [Tanacetum coccineum]